MYSLYWIRHTHHSDIYSEGYVGVTSDTRERFLTHQRGAGNPIVYNAIKKGASMEVIKEDLTFEEVCAMELLYRPSENIGWNLAPGGQVPPPQKGKSKKNSKQGLVGDKRTRAQQLAAKKHSDTMRGRTSPLKGKRRPNLVGKNNRPCVYKGMTFESRTAAANHFGVCISAVTNYIRRHREQQNGL